MKESLQLLIDDELKAGNLLSFPSSESNTVAVLNKENPTDKFILIFDIRRDGFFRRLIKK